MLDFRFHKQKCSQQKIYIFVLFIFARSEFVAPAVLQSHDGNKQCFFALVNAATGSVYYY
jgi:hypothetical protein